MATRTTGTILIVLGVIGLVIGALITGYAMTEGEADTGWFGDEEQAQEQVDVLTMSGMGLVVLSLVAVVLGIVLTVQRGRR